jgi:hypothetical protein
MKPPSRLRRRLLILTSLVLLFTVVGFFVLPPIVKSQLQKRLSAELGRRVTVEKVRLNPYTLSATLERFAIHEPDGTSVFVGWRRLHVNVGGLASIWKEWALSEIVLEGFTASVAIKPDASLNFSDILAKVSPPGVTPPPKSKPSRPIRVGSLRVSDARLDFSDTSASRPFATTVGPMTFALTEFRTSGERGAPYRFEAVTESGEKLSWLGTIQAEPLRSAGEFNVEGIVLAKYAPYYAHRIQADLVEGKLGVRGGYEVSIVNGQRSAVLRNGAVQLRGLKILERASRDVALELPVLAVTGIQADAVTQKGTVDLVALNGGHIRARREKDGTINLLSMLQPPTGTAPAVATTTSTPPASAPKGPPPPDVKIGEVSVRDLRVDVADLAAPRPVQLAVNGIQLSMRSVTLAEGAQMPLQLALGLGAQGTVKVDGTVGISPLHAELKTELSGIEMLPLSPYLEEFVNARITQGAVTARLETQALMTDNEKLAATVSGEVTVAKFGLVDAAHNEELAGFGSVALRGLRASTGATMKVSLDEINVAAPYARVIMSQDKKLNLATLVRSTPPPAATDAPVAPPTEAPKPASPAAQPVIEIGKITIADGDYRFLDRSIQPNVSMAMKEFGGTISELSSTNPGKASLDLKAKVDGSGLVAISGKVDPLSAKKSADLKVDVKNVDLLPLSAYSGKFAGFELARGKLLLDVKAMMEGTKIDASNVITLNQFTFGNPVKSPDATSLPVRLGVALLKDLNGNIVIDVPIQGSTDDPSFGIGRVVGRVIVNLLTKAAVSPFALLGAAFGGGGEELAFQEFAPGAAELQPGEMKKLETMVKALTNRPGLSLDLQGSFDAAADTYALKRVKLTDTVRRAVWELKRRSDPNIPPPDQLVISPEENNAMIKTLYDQKFPPGTEFGAPIPKPPVTPPPPEPPPGLLKRVINVVTFKSLREERAAKNEEETRVAEQEKAVAAAVASDVALIPVEVMTTRLSDAMDVDDNDLRALAHARAQRVRDHFANVGKIAPERLFLAKDQGPTDDKRKGPRVFLNLQ